MKCPHCGFAGKSPITETRNDIDALYRRRSCGSCGRAFVTCEHAPPGLKMPPQHNNRAPAKPPTPKHQPIRSDGAHLQGVWSLLPKEK